MAVSRVTSSFSLVRITRQPILTKVRCSWLPYVVLKGKSGCVYASSVRTTRAGEESKISAMAIHTTNIEPHWNYLLALERSLDELSRYVEFHKRNFRCFSVEIARLLLACGAEVDVVCKQICQAHNTASRAETILQYRREIVSAFPGVTGFKVLLPNYGLTLRPWDEWRKTDGVPHWWTAYNKTKHQRQTEYHQANLKNMLNAIAGLFVVVLYFYKDKAENGKLAPPPRLLHVEPKHFVGFSEGINSSVFLYKLH